MTGRQAWRESSTAAQRLAELRSATELLFDDFAAASAQRRAASLRRLLLALELRWKLEEELVIPALRGTDGEPPETLGAADRESGLLRELAAVAKAGLLPPAPLHTLMAAIEGFAALRSERIERALARAQLSSGVGALALRREIDALLERWHGEVLASGDIEDEELDPVGLPPR